MPPVAAEPIKARICTLSESEKAGGAALPVALSVEASIRGLSSVCTPHGHTVMDHLRLDLPVNRAFCCHAVGQPLLGAHRLKHLRPVPREGIYPVFPAQELTEFKPQEGVEIFFKKPKLAHYKDGCDDLSSRVLDAARTQGKLLHNQHPGLGHYLGCVVDGGRIVRLAFRKYKHSLSHRVWHQTAEEFPERQRLDCMERIEQAARHLHSTGLAHNDISPANIMFDGADEAVLIDLDACLPVGSRIVKGGLVAGWKGPMHDNGREFKESSTELDELAIAEIRTYLAEDFAKKA